MQERPFAVNSTWHCFVSRYSRYFQVSSKRVAICATKLWTINSVITGEHFNLPGMEDYFCFFAERFCFQVSMRRKFTLQVFPISFICVTDFLREKKNPGFLPTFCWIRIRNIWVTIETDEGLDGRVKRFFSTTQGRDRLWGPTSLLSSGYQRALSSKKKWQGREADYLHLVSRSRMVELYFQSPMRFHSVVLN
jgi:hypothetical protein